MGGQSDVTLDSVSGIHVKLYWTPLVCLSVWWLTLVVFILCLSNCILLCVSFYVPANFVCWSIEIAVTVFEMTHNFMQAHSPLDHTLMLYCFFFQRQLWLHQFPWLSLEQDPLLGLDLCPLVGNLNTFGSSRLPRNTPYLLRFSQLYWRSLTTPLHSRAFAYSLFIYNMTSTTMCGATF